MIKITVNLNARFFGEPAQRNGLVENRYCNLAFGLVKRILECIIYRQESVTGLDEFTK